MKRFVVKMILTGIFFSAAGFVFAQPQSVSECINTVAKQARTEVGAKAAIALCNEKPSVSEQECLADSKSYASLPKTNPALDQARKNIPELNGLDDQQALDVIHEVYYPNMDKAELAKKIGIVPSPHRATCKKLYPALYKQE